MNIGIVTTWFERGAAYVSRAYRDTLLNGGNNVFIFARGGEKYAEGDAEWDDPSVMWSTRYNPISKLTKCNRNYINPLQIEEWLHKNEIDIVIFNEEHGVECVSKVADLGYVVGAYVDYYKKSTVEQFNTYDFLLCNTKRHYSVFKNHSNAFFLQWGTDTTLFSPTQPAEMANKRQPIVFFHSAGMGGTNTRKGTDLTIKAFQDVTGNARLIIHSQVGRQKYGSEVAQLIDNDDRIKFIEKTVKAPGLYHLGDIFVYPTRLEGIGLCVPEALACGLPVITTDCPPMSEFVTNNHNGLLVEVETTQKRSDNYYWPESIVSIRSLTEKMQTYTNNKQLVHEHQKNARNSAESLFCWQANSAVLNSLLEKFHPTARQEIRRFSTTEILCNMAISTNLTLQTHFKKFFPQNKVF